jgi:hypothetical protein
MRADVSVSCRSLEALDDGIVTLWEHFCGAVESLVNICLAVFAIRL